MGLELSQVNPAQLVPPRGMVLAGNGQTVICHSATNAYLLRNFITLKAPQATDVTPSDLGSYQIKAVLFDPFSPKTAVSAYLLASDGTNSAVWYTSNVAAALPTWTKGADCSGVYTVIRAGNAAGKALIYANDSSASSFTIDDDLTTGLGPSTGLVDATHLFGVWGTSYSAAGSYSASGGRTSGGSILGQSVGTFGSPPSVKTEATAYIDLGTETTITAASFWFKNGANGKPRSAQMKVWDASKALIGILSGAISDFSSSTSYQQCTFSGSQAGVRYISFSAEQNASDGTPNIDDLSVTAGSFGGATVRYSSDNGATFGGEISVGSAASGATGCDTQRAGTNSFAACSGKVRRATSLGGAYSDYFTPSGSAQAACVVIPYYKWGSTTVRNTSATNPDIVVGLSDADGSSRTLLWLEGGAGSPSATHDITPTANYVCDQPNAITTSYGTAIAVAGKVSSTYTLRTSTTLGGAGTWNNRGTISAPTFIRTRRNDNSILRGKGQLYLTDQSGAVIDYSGRWGTVLYPRTMPVSSGIVGFDIYDG